MSTFSPASRKGILTEQLHPETHSPSEKKERKTYHMLQTLKVNCSPTYNSGVEALKPQKATSIPSSELAAILSAGALVKPRHGLGATPDRIPHLHLVSIPKRLLGS